eukprot:scaffold7197_cov88-Skeletonema_menzelii.AAC.33
MQGVTLSKSGKLRGQLRRSSESQESSRSRNFLHHHRSSIIRSSKLEAIAFNSVSTLLYRR